MLSRRDYINELGKKLLIYPFSSTSLDDSSYSLRASAIAYELDEKKSAYNPSDKTIVIPSHKAVLIVTAESISLQKRLNGICLSGVSNASWGLLACSTPVKCGWIGRLIITIVNISNEDRVIHEGDKIGVLVVDRHYTSMNNFPQNRNGNTALILRRRIGDLNEKIEAELSEECYTDIKVMKSRLLNESDYKTVKSELPQRRGRIIAFVLVFVGLIALSGFLFGFKDIFATLIGALIGSMAPVVYNKFIR